MQIKQEENFYKTKDQMLAALLYATGYALESTDWTAGVCYFYFADKPKCEQTVSEYYKGKIIINAKLLFDSFQTIKNILFAK